MLCVDKTQSGLVLKQVVHIQWVSFIAVLNAAVIKDVPANAGFLLDKAAVLRGTCTVKRDCNCVMWRRHWTGCQVLRLDRGMAFQTLTWIHVAYRSRHDVWLMRGWATHGQ